MLLNKDNDIDFSVLVTGAHLEAQFGQSVDLIRKDGFRIETEIKIDIDTSSNSKIIHSMSVALDQFGAYFENSKKDLLIVLGDRYEMMAAVIAAAMQKIPILHLHGGELTYGNYDEFIRHCITKMSNFHFTSTESYRNRVLQLGESPERVFNLGALGTENCLHIDSGNVNKWISRLPKKQYFVVLFHPETLTGVDQEAQVNQVLIAIESFIKQYSCILIGSNADTFSDKVRNCLKKFSDKYDKIRYIETMNVDSYLYLVKNSLCLIGNSSSGIIEAPTLGTYSINIGKRQRGRIHGESVIDVECNSKDIEREILKIIKNPNNGSPFENPYYQSDMLRKYYTTTKNILLKLPLQPKEFYDINLDGGSVSC